MQVVVIGSGIAGLAAAWLLSARHEVHLLERAERLGGHTHTITVPRADGPPVGIDTGFVVYNEPTYPLLTRLLETLEVATQPSDMSWSLRCERCDLEYAGNAAGLVSQPRRLADPTYLGMLRDVLRFNRLARRLVADPRSDTITVGHLLETTRFGHGFRAHYLLPMAAAIWSSGTGTIEGFPVGSLLRFLDNHGLLGIRTHHPWRTVVGGSASYLAPLTAPLAGRIRTDVDIAGLERDADGVTVRFAAGPPARFDAAVVATHADEALALLADPTPLERELLGAWRYSTNDTWLHTDRTLLPRSPRAWASWNYRLDDCTTPAERVSLSYHMNRLQQLDEPRDYVVTLNPARQPAEGTVVRRMTYTHPVYTQHSVETQPLLDELNGQRHTFFAGAYHRNGFHEDALFSAVRVAAHLGVEWPR